MRITPSRAFLVGLAVGLAGVASLAVSQPLPGPVADTGTPPADAFLAAWERSRLGTWLVEARFTRVTEAGGRLTFTIHHAQRPPDELRFGFGSVTARRGGSVLACAGGERGPGSLRCRESAAARPWADEVAAEMALLRTYVHGTNPLYSVRQLPLGCFELAQARPFLSAPYGVKARFCFDGSTGAPTYSKIVRAEGTDVTDAVRVEDEVTEEDLAPPPPG